jgi:tetratricopeptide (TPR) repeat protein
MRGVEEARRARTRLEALETNADKAGEELFTRQIRILRLELAAWLAHVEGDGRSGVSLSRQAAELEVSTPKHAVTPAPTLPAHELLGELLMEQKLFREALVAYKRSLELYPRRFNSLLGAARTARATGDKAFALTFYRDLLAVAAEGSSRTGLEEARRFVSEHASPIRAKPGSPIRRPPNKALQRTRPAQAKESRR